MHTPSSRRLPLVVALIATFASGLPEARGTVGRAAGRRHRAGGDFNGDGFSDLAIGVPGEGPEEEQGAVNVLYGSPTA